MATTTYSVHVAILLHRSCGAPVPSATTTHAACLRRIPVPSLMSYVAFQCPHSCRTSYSSVLTHVVRRIPVPSLMSYVAFQCPHSCRTSHSSVLTHVVRRIPVPSLMWYVAFQCPHSCRTLHSSVLPHVVRRIPMSSHMSRSFPLTNHTTRVH